MRSASTGSDLAGRLLGAGPEGGNPDRREFRSDEEREKKIREHEARVGAWYAAMHEARTCPCGGQRRLARDRLRCRRCGSFHPVPPEYEACFGSGRRRAVAS